MIEHMIISKDPNYVSLGFYNRIEYQVQHKMSIKQYTAASKYLRRLIRDVTQDIVINHCV